MKEAAARRLERWAAAEVAATLAALPAPLAAEARRLAVVFEPRPGRALRRSGVEPDTLGLFTGAEFAEEGSDPLPAHITLFLANLWDEARHEETAFREEVRITYLHELGHYLGLGEDDLFDRGLE